MNGKEILKNLIDNPKNPSVSEWVYEVESFLNDINGNSSETKKLIQDIKQQGDVFLRCENLVASLRQLYKRKYDRITLPQIKKRHQIFVAMMFSDDTDSVYENVYKSVVRFLNYCAMRIDEKQFNGSIIGEITGDITDSVALIADLTGNRGGVSRGAWKMSKLKKLFQVFCPDGVSYYTIPKLFNTRNGYTPSKANPGYLEEWRGTLV